jgi:chorismate-pyruvate lyase
MLEIINENNLLTGTIPLGKILAPTKIFTRECFYIKQIPFFLLNG